LTATRRLGRENEIFPFASLGLKTQDLKWKGGVTRTEIGDGNTFREYVTIHSATGDGEVTRVGSHNTILAYCHIAHNCTSAATSSCPTSRRWPAM
jgi:UDP-N-acetylglucosamine acyltransferase